MTADMPVTTHGALKRLRNLAAFAMLGCVVAGSMFGWSAFNFNPDIVHAVGVACGVFVAIATGIWRTA